MTFNEFITILISLLSLLFSVSALGLQIRTSYPRIRIETFPYEEKNKNNIYSSLFDNQTKSLYFFAKINIVNMSPIRGCLHNCFLKCHGAKKLPALTEYEIKSLPKKIYLYYEQFAKQDELFNKRMSAEPLEEKTAVVVFNLTYRYTYSNRYKIFATYYGESKTKATTKFNAPFKMEYFMQKINLGQELFYKEVKEFLSGKKQNLP